MLMSDEKKTCSVEDCSIAVHSRDSCPKHYARLRRTGSTDIKPTKNCSVIGCIGKHKAHGLCEKHYRNSNSEKNNQRSRNWRKRYPEKVAANNKKIESRFTHLLNQSKSRGLVCSLTFQEFENLSRLNCYYCDSVFPKTEYGSSLDRICNKKGYEIDNVLPCCGICNKTRNVNFTVEETKAMIQLVIVMRKERKS